MTPATIEDFVEKYTHIITGQDLIDQGIRPKTPEQGVALITVERLKGLRAIVEADLTNDLLGTWIPVFQPTYTTLGKTIEGAQLQQYARPGWKITVKRDNAEINRWNPQIGGMNGTIIDIQGTAVYVEFDTQQLKNINMTSGTTHPQQRQQGEKNVIQFSGSQFFIGEVPEDQRKIEQGFELRTDAVVVHKNNGHLVRFNEDYTYQNPDNYRQNITLPKGTTAILTEYKKGKFITIKTLGAVKDDKIAANQRNFSLPLEDRIKNVLQASSLGQKEPEDKEAVIHREVLNKFFPSTVLDVRKEEEVVIGLLTGRDLILYGPPGSGKSNLCKDIVDLTRQQGVLFKVKGCQANCNPYSLFDGAFSKLVPPCPACKIEYDPDFKETGRFRRPAPEKVKVQVAAYDFGQNIEKKQMSTATGHADMVGFKLPDMDNGKEATIDESNPKGFRPGFLVRTNNGVMWIDELDKIRPTEKDHLLEPLNDNRVLPPGLRYAYPCRSFIVATANSQEKFEGPITDRVLVLPVGYPIDVETNFLIIRRAKYKETIDLKEVPIKDLATREALDLERPVPVIVGRAISAFYHTLRQTGKVGDYALEPEQGSIRSNLHAFEAAQAKLVLDEILKDNFPRIITPEYAISGLKHALYSRIQEDNIQTEQNRRNTLEPWIQQTFNERLEEEKRAWWCDTTKALATMATQSPGLQERYEAELAKYAQGDKAILEGFRAAREAKKNPADTRKHAKASAYPFMNYLFIDGEGQPGIDNVTEAQAPALIKYLLEAKKVLPEE
ncbi:MAG: hypothetical protein Q7R96_06065 [Nanoarchaeota archaeon]|nr:hypothetical protein [Nanoarchaeota archaeon]